MFSRAYRRAGAGHDAEAAAICQLGLWTTRWTLWTRLWTSLSLSTSHGSSTTQVARCPTDGLRSGAMNEDRLAELAVELAVRVRREDPDDVADWLLAATSERDRWQLLFAQAAVGPVTAEGFRRAKAWAARAADAQPEIVDEIAVERACNGEPIALTRTELLVAVHKLTDRGLGSREIAARLRTNQRQVTRFRSEGRAA